MVLTLAAVPLFFSLVGAVVPLTPAHAAVRRALARNDVVAAEAALAADVDKAAVPGLQLALLEAKNEAKADPAACALATALLKSQKDLNDVVAVHVARCAPDQTVLLQVGAGPFRHHPAVLDALAAFVGAGNLAAVDVDKLLAPALSAPLPLSDAEQRRAAAGALRALRLKGSEKAQGLARLRLLDELPEHATAKDREGDVDTTARRVARGGVLEKLHDNEAVIALLQDLVGKNCEASLLVGKAHRKLRHYGAARIALAAAGNDACGEVQKKARYLEARVARVQGAGSADKLLSTFVKLYGSDPLVDDVLLWLAELRAGAGDIVGSTAALQAILDEHGGGDMADEARFRLALSLARQKKTAAALTAFDAAIAALQKQPRPRTDLLDRTRYWRLRLAVFPDLETLTPNKDASDDDKAALAAFAADRGSSFYGLMAGLLLPTLSLPTPSFGEPRAVSSSSSSSVALSVPLPASLERDPRFVLAQRAVNAGFDDDATFLLTELVDDADAASVDHDGVAFAAAALFVQLNRPDLSHQTLRNAGLALLPGALRGDEAVHFTLSWPRAFAAEITAAAELERIPPTLLMGLAREESAFTHDVISWAGAIGLCQLMPGTAADEAQALKKTGDLLDPAWNARLGAAHLGRRLRGMSHPLLAIGAYNAGPGSVAKWMPPPGQKRPLDIFVEDIPVDETRGYIKKVTGSWNTYVTLDKDTAVSFPLWVKSR